MLCRYGCGKEGIRQFKDKTWCCSQNIGQCSEIARRRVATRKAKDEPWHSKKTCDKIGNATRGRELSEEWCQNISKATKGKSKGPQSEEHRQNLAAVRKGKTPWNKGLTVEDPRVASYVDKQTGQIRQGNYMSPTKWQGSGNPWYGKNRSKDNSPRYNGEQYNRELSDYRHRVIWLSEITYEKYKNQINPMNYPRTLAGVDGGFHLDHIYPIAEGFDNNIPPEMLAELENLRLLPWRENVAKSKNLLEEIISESIKTYLKENK